MGLVNQAYNFEVAIISINVRLLEVDILLPFLILIIMLYSVNLFLKQDIISSFEIIDSLQILFKDLKVIKGELASAIMRIMLHAPCLGLCV